MKDSDWIYRGYSVPWLSHDPVHIEISGFGFLNIFDAMHAPELTEQKFGNLDGWEFVGFWRPEFPGWNPIGLLVFRKRNG
jgi:hypothetical protein